jgi:hypothetical protein
LRRNVAGHTSCAVRSTAHGMRLAVPLRRCDVGRYRQPLSPAQHAEWNSRLFTLLLYGAYRRAPLSQSPRRASKRQVRPLRSAHWLRGSMRSRSAWACARSALGMCDLCSHCPQRRVVVPPLSRRLRMLWWALVFSASLTTVRHHHQVRTQWAVDALRRKLDAAAAAC